MIIAAQTIIGRNKDTIGLPATAPLRQIFGPAILENGTVEVIFLQENLENGTV